MRTLIALALIFLGCAEIEEIPEKRNVKQRPIMLFQDTTMLDFHEKGRLVWKLKTLYLERWAGSERIFAKPIIVDLYDSLGAHLAYLQADSGSLDTKMTFIVAKGNVKAQSPKGAMIQADSLTWDRESNRVRTESRVRVLSEHGDVLSGKGFISDANLDNWQIISDVKAILQDAGPRLKSEL